MVLPDSEGGCADLLLQYLVNLIRICAELLLHCLLTLRWSLQNFSKIAKPVTQLLCKGKRYSWSSACQSTFDELKKKLTTAPILTPPDESQSFQVFCDASLQGLGGSSDARQEHGGIYLTAVEDK